MQMLLRSSIPWPGKDGCRADGSATSPRGRGKIMRPRRQAHRIDSTRTGTTR